MLLGLAWMMTGNASAFAWNVNAEFEVSSSHTLDPQQFEQVYNIDAHESSRQDLSLSLSADDSYDHFYWVVNTLTRYDTLDSPVDARVGDREYDTESDIRDLYLGTQLGEWQLTLGWQQIVWGNADELRVVDRINPETLREFVLPNLADRRQAIPLLRGSRYLSLGNLGEWQFEGIYIPRFYENTQAARASEFSVLDKDPLFSQLSVIDAQGKNHKDQHNNEFATRLSGQIGSADVSFMAFKTVDDNPVFGTQFLENGGIQLEEQYGEYTLFGSTVSLPLGGHVLRFETAHLQDFDLMTAGNLSGITEKNVTHYLLGWDYLIKDWMLTAQFNNRHIHDWKLTILDDRTDPLFTLSLQGASLNGKLDTRLSYAQYLENDNGSFFQMQSRYALSDALKIGLALDVFNGQREGFLGQFKTSNRLKLTIGYSYP